MMTTKLPMRALPGAKFQSRCGPVLPGRCTLRVNAVIRPDVSMRSSSRPTPPSGVPHSPPPPPGSMPQPGPLAGMGTGGPLPGGAGAGAGASGSSGSATGWHPVAGGTLASVTPGLGGSSQPPAPTSTILDGSGGSSGSSGGSGGSGGSGPSGGSSSGGGFDWTKLILAVLGLALAIPAWKYVNRRFLKPEPEHTIAKVEDKAAELKSKNLGQKAVSNVKHAAADARDSVSHTVGSGVQAVKNAEAKVVHKAEDLKDAASAKLHAAGNSVEAGAHKAKTESKHALDHAETKAEEAKAKADAKVKADRTVQRGKDKAGAAVKDAEVSTAKGTKSVLESIKGAAHTVGKKLHVVADSTDKGIKKGADKTERALGLKGPIVATTTDDRTKIYAITGATVLTTGALAAALYYWDRKGGDIKGKLHKLQDRTKEAADKVVSRTNEALNRGGDAQVKGPVDPALTIKAPGNSGLASPNTVLSKRAP